MDKLSSSVVYETERFGVFDISTNKKHTIVWWDIEGTGGLDGIELSPEGLDGMDWIDEYIGIKLDFSDLPKFGEFKNHDEAYNYLVSKFGNLE